MNDDDNSLLACLKNLKTPVSELSLEQRSRLTPAVRHAALMHRAQQWGSSIRTDRICLPVKVEFGHTPSKTGGNTNGAIRLAYSQNNLIVGQIHHFVCDGRFSWSPAIGESTGCDEEDALGMLRIFDRFASDFFPRGLVGGLHSR